MVGFGAGGALSAGGHRLIQLATGAVFLGGLGLAGAGAYGYSQPTNQAMSFAKDNAPLLIAVGVGAVVLGGLLNWWTSGRMMKQMTTSMPSMMGMGALIGGGPAVAAASAAPAVKVRCRSCGNLEAEQAAFCSKGGTAMT